MRDKILAAIIILMFAIVSACVPPGQVKKQTGYNPASGKMKHK